VELGTLGNGRLAYRVWNYGVMTMHRTRHGFFIAIMAIVVGMFWRPLCILVSLSFHQSAYSHLGLIPLISIGLISSRGTKVFNESVFPDYAGAIPFLGGLALYVVTAHFGEASAEPNVLALSLSIIGFLFACVGAFCFSYGCSAVRASLFPLGFLLFAVPLPAIVLEKVIHLLQEGSADVAALLLRTCGVPFFRDRLVFQLPGISIEVAPECSGIRSSTALLITTVLAAQFVLRSNYRKLALCMLLLPVAMFKNGLRIATLSILSVYVSRDFLYGWLHRSGGVVFFLIGLAVICLALRLLQLGDRPFALGKTEFPSPSQAEI
jgi:exosortase